VLDIASAGGSRVRQNMRLEMCEFWATVPDPCVPIT
jgi:hypothetical protein